MSSKRCKNYDNSNKIGYYKGNEPSPKGKGFCAKYELEGTIKEGKDGNLWEVIGGRWVKAVAWINKAYKSKKLRKSRKSVKSKKLRKSRKSRKSKKSKKSRKSKKYRKYRKSRKSRK